MTHTYKIRYKLLQRYKQKIKCFLYNLCNNNIRLKNFLKYFEISNSSEAKSHNFIKLKDI